MTNKPTLYSTAFKIVADDNLKEIGKVVKITPKHIWVDRSAICGQTWLDKYKVNGDPTFYKTTDQFKNGFRLKFEPNPLEEFISHGITKEKK